MNEPRCELMSGEGGSRCRNQAAGTWAISRGERRIYLCEYDREELDSHGAQPLVCPWEPLIPDPVQSAIRRRVDAMAAGYFG